MKYKILFDQTLNYEGRTLHRIQALKSFKNALEGDIGGWIEDPRNLSHEGNCWVKQDAKVFDNASIKDNAIVLGDAVVKQFAKVYGDAVIDGKAMVSGYAEVFDDAVVANNAYICSGAKAYGSSIVYGNAYVRGCAEINGNALVGDNSSIEDYAVITGGAKIKGNAMICSNAIVKNLDDYIVFKNWWSSGRYFTWTRSNNKWKVGCFYGTGEELISKAYKDSQRSGQEYERIVRYVEAITNEKEI